MQGDNSKMTVDREEILNGKTVRVKTGCGYMYVTVNFKEEKPFEVFLEIGKAGGCVSSQAEALGRLTSVCLRNGVDINKIIAQLSEIYCNLPLTDHAKSCADAIAIALKKLKEKGDIKDDSL